MSQAEEVKGCTSCGREMRLDQFGRHAQGRFGRKASCLECSRANSRREYSQHREVRLAATKARREADPCRHRTMRRAQKMRRQYGLTEADYQAMVQSQGGRCAICEERRPLKVDHCHSGGQVRALLCGPCNTALGSFQDRPDLLERAATYLRGHSR